MSYIYKSISGDTATVLLGGQRYEDSQTLKAIVITNTHASDSCSVDLYLSKTISDTSPIGHLGNWNDRDTSETKHYFIKGVVIPKGTALVLEGHDVTYSQEGSYLVYIKLAAADSTVDVKSYLSAEGVSAAPYIRSRIVQDNSELRKGTSPMYKGGSSGG